MPDIDQIPADPEIRRQWIKYQLKIRGASLASIAREHQVDRNILSTALKRGSPRWDYEIAQVLGLTPQKLWPERYDQNGLPIWNRQK